MCPIVPPVTIRRTIHTKYTELHPTCSGFLTVFHPNGAHISTRSYSEAGQECLLVEMTDAGSVVHVGNHNCLPYTGDAILFGRDQVIVVTYEDLDRRLLYAFDPGSRTITPYAGKTPWLYVVARLHVNYADVRTPFGADSASCMSDTSSLAVSLTKADIYVLSLFRHVVKKLNVAGYCRQRYELAAEFFPEVFGEGLLARYAGPIRISVEKDYVILTGEGPDNTWRFFVESTALEHLINKTTK